MSLSRWEPFGEFSTLRRQIDRLFDEFSRPLMGTRAGTYFFPLNTYQTDNELIVKADIPGVKPEDINITVSGDMLTIRAQRKPEQVKPEERIVSEIPYGTFERDITLPFPVQADQAQAKYENGELTLTLPKSAAARSKTIKVQAVQGQQSKQIGRA